MRENRILHGHNGEVGTSEWLTPPDLLAKLGEFDLDPCSPVDRPWPTARHHYTILDDGLRLDWFKRVFLNPPFDRHSIEAWMKRMADHNNGIALLFARTDTDTWHKHIFDRADSLLFINKRLHFYNVLGERSKNTCGAPCILIGYGEANSEALSQSGIAGKHLLLNRLGVVVVGYDRSWREIVQGILVNMGDPMSVERIYELVKQVAPTKVSGKAHVRAKVRQILQLNFKRVGRGTYTA